MPEIRTKFLKTKLAASLISRVIEIQMQLKINLGNLFFPFCFYAKKKCRDKKFRLRIFYIFSYMSSVDTSVIFSFCFIWKSTYTFAENAVMWSTFCMFRHWINIFWRKCSRLGYQLNDINSVLFKLKILLFTELIYK